MINEGHVEITGVPGSKYPLIRMDKEAFESAAVHAKAMCAAFIDGKMILCGPDPLAFWKYVEAKQLFAFADGYEAIVGAGLYSYKGTIHLITIYDAERLIDTSSYVSRGSNGEEVSDDYAKTLLASFRRQGSPETNDCVGLRFK